MGKLTSHKVIFFNKIIIGEEWVGNAENKKDRSKLKGDCGTINIQEKIPKGGARCINADFNKRYLRCQFKFKRTCTEKQGTVTLNHRGKKIVNENHSVDVCELDVEAQQFDLDNKIYYSVINI